MASHDLNNSIYSKILAARLGQPLQVKIEKDRYDVALDKSIERHLDGEEIIPDQLLTIRQKKIQAQTQLKTNLESSNLEEMILNAIETLIDEGRAYLSDEDYEAMKSNFKQAEASLEKLNLDQRLEMNFDQILGIKVETIDAIFSVAVALFEEGQNQLALSLFTLLTILQPDQYDFWYRTAILAQVSGDLDLALQAYRQALDLNDQLIEAYLFSAECYLKKGSISEAKETFQKAEALMATLSVAEDVPEMAHQIKQMLS